MPYRYPVAPVRSAIALTLALAALGAAPSAAPAATVVPPAATVVPPEHLIVPQHGIAGVRLGMTYRQVRDTLGVPSSASYARIPVFGRVLFVRYGPIKISLPSLSKPVMGISTMGRADRTAKGIGVGSPRSAVQRRVPGVHCFTTPVRQCYLGSFRRGRVITAFSLSRHGFVTQVAIARIP